MWCDSSTEAFEFLDKHGDKDQWREVPPHERPSFRKYWREHSVAQMAGRLWKGSLDLATQNARAIGYYKFVIVLLIGGVVLGMERKRPARALFVTHRLTAIFCLLFLAAYFVLYAWYDRIINDTRFVLSIFLPFVFAVSLFLLRLGEDRTVSMAGREFRFDQFFGALLLGLSTIDVLYNAPSLFR
jgi:hypothetical protein